MRFSSRRFWVPILILFVFGLRALAQAGAESKPGLIDSAGVWFYGVYIMGRKVGWIRSEEKVVDFEGVQAKEINYDGTISMGGMDKPMLISARRVYTVAGGQLLYLSNQINSVLGDNFMEARRQDNFFKVVTQVGGKRRETSIPAQSETLDEMAAVNRLISSNARPGDSITVNTFFIEMMEMSPITVVLKGRRKTIINGVEVELYDLDIIEEELGVTLSSVVDSKGVLIEGYLGPQFALRLEDESVATDISANTGLIFEMGVFPSTPIQDIGGLGRISLMVRGVDDPMLRIQEPWQVWEPAADGWKLTMEQVRAPINPPPIPIQSPDLAPFLKPSLIIQSDDQEIISTARAIIGAETDSWQAANLLSEWVYKNINKQLVGAYSNALETLHALSGDCTEHSILFAALARAVGIPTRIASGLAYVPKLNGFFYHQWDEVWINGWIPVDPTFGQSVADLGHIAFIVGEGLHSARILKIVGGVRIDVLGTWVNLK